MSDKNLTSRKVIDLEEKRCEKELRETGMISCNLPFKEGEFVPPPKPSWWKKIILFFTKADITPKEIK